MLQVARLAPNQLRDSSALVARFFQDQLNDDGGFRNRDGTSDLYYTVFGIEGIIALRQEPPVERIVPFVQRFADGEELDLVHLACLARCHAGLGGRAFSHESREVVARRLSTFRSRDGGYSNESGGEKGTVYGCFLALGAYQDIERDLPDPPGVRAFVDAMETADGGYANDAGMQEGTTTATAAAVTLLRNLGYPGRPEAGEWLLARCQEGGGFLAMPRAPMPDLLSTATAIHALAGLQHPFDSVRESCLDFVDSLWTNRGAFHGHWLDDQFDCEYTYYGLLALGHLTL